MSDGTLDHYCDVIELTTEEVEAIITKALKQTGFSTVGQLRDDIRQGRSCECSGCFDYDHPNVREWEDIRNAMFLLGRDWRAAP